MNIVYMGTPDFAATALEALINEGHNIIAVVTQPDKPKGRGKTLSPTPVKEKAMEHDIKVYQPIKVRDEEFVKILEDLNPEVIVVAAFGQILPESILNIPKFGCINIHASLLPKYRGAAPIERSILDGETKTGVTIMYMEKGLDTGDMIDKVVVDIEDNDTGATLTNKLAKAGASLICETLIKVENGTADRVTQNDDESTYAKMLSKDMGKIDFNADAAVIERMLRALDPWPSAYTFLDGKLLRIFEARIVDKKGTPAEVIEVTKKTFTVACGDKALEIKRLQIEGKKIMDTVAFLNGNKITVGMKLGE